MSPIVKHVRYRVNVLDWGRPRNETPRTGGCGYVQLHGQASDYAGGRCSEHVGTNGSEVDPPITSRGIS